jgi:hypothetical protein
MSATVLAKKYFVAPETAHFPPRFNFKFIREGTIKKSNIPGSSLTDK